MNHTDISVFIEKLHKIASDLEHLGSEFSELSEQYDGSDFEGQQELAANKLENLLIASTHEVASEIGFYASDIQTLADFINFRRQYKSMSNTELQEIIDNKTISLSFKLDLSQRLTNSDTKQMLKTIEEIQHQWNNAFQNQTYQSVSRNFCNNISKT